MHALLKGKTNRCHPYVPVDTFFHIFKLIWDSIQYIADKKFTSIPGTATAYVAKSY